VDYVHVHITADLSFEKRERERDFGERFGSSSVLARFYERFMVILDHV